MKIYPSKISYGLLLFILLIFLLPFFISGKHVVGFNTPFIITFLTLTCSFGFILHLFFTTKYIINNEILQIKSGILINNKVNIKTIKSIQKTKSILSSPAASFDRILIKYNKYDEVIISPKNKLEFVNDLKIINPNISSDISG